MAEEACLVEWAGETVAAATAVSMAGEASSPPAALAAAAVADS